jgi:hypothetical protein
MKIFLWHEAGSFPGEAGCGSLAQSMLLKAASST